MKFAEAILQLNYGNFMRPNLWKSEYFIDLSPIGKIRFNGVETLSEVDVNFTSWEVIQKGDKE